MKVGIIYNETKAQSKQYVDLLREAILRISCELTRCAWTVVDQRDASLPSLAEQVDMLISVGGDGTFLKSAYYAILNDIPVFGFNLGTFGLLTEFDAYDPEQCIRKLVSGNYIVEDRRTLKVEVRNRSGELCFSEYALNDCVIERNALSGVAYISLSINGNYVDTYPCNGIVVATQTGSTAYSLSAGGPIVEPGNDVNVVTPVCAHSPDTRPIVTRVGSLLEFRLCRSHNSMFVSVDGHRNTEFKQDDLLLCMPCDKTLKIVRIDPPDFYEALRRKSQERRRKLADET